MVAREKTHILHSGCLRNPTTRTTTKRERVEERAEGKEANATEEDEEAPTRGLDTCTGVRKDRRDNTDVLLCHPLQFFGREWLSTLRLLMIQLTSTAAIDTANTGSSTISNGMATADIDE